MRPGRRGSTSSVAHPIAQRWRPRRAGVLEPLGPVPAFAQPALTTRARPAARAAQDPRPRDTGAARTRFVVRSPRHGRPVRRDHEVGSARVADARLADGDREAPRGRDAMGARRTRRGPRSHRGRTPRSGSGSPGRLALADVVDGGDHYGTTFGDAASVHEGMVRAGHLLPRCPVVIGDVHEGLARRSRRIPASAPSSRSSPSARQRVA